MTGIDDSRAAAFNRKWSRRESAFAANAPLPYWAPGLVITDDIRRAYNDFLPINEYAHDLASVLAEVLPRGRREEMFSAWIPKVLRTPRIRSLPDLWDTLPEPFGGRLTWDASELWSLACAIAAPPRFGTATGRYPEQLAMVRSEVAHLGSTLR